MHFKLIYHWTLLFLDDPLAFILTEILHLCEFFLDGPSASILAEILNDQIARILVENRDPCVIDFFMTP